jgi:hypothetical protein
VITLLVLVITGDNFAGGTTDTVLDGTLPAGAKVLDVYTEIALNEEFTVGNGDNILEIGTAGSVASHGVELSANLEVAGLYTDTPPATINGDWASQLAADTAVGAIVSGTTPALSAGTAKVVITYVNM